MSGNLIPVGGQNDNVLVSCPAAKFLKHPQITAGLATEPRVGYPLEVYETTQLSVQIISYKLPLLHETKDWIPKDKRTPGVRNRQSFSGYPYR